MRAATKLPDGTSYHGTTIVSTPQKLIDLCKRLDCEWQESDGGDDEKSYYDFVFETEKGDVFTVYDWKEGRKAWKDSLIEFHIGAKTTSISLNAYYQLSHELAR